jgi:hypothetical protein
MRKEELLLSISKLSWVDGVVCTIMGDSDRETKKLLDVCHQYVLDAKSMLSDELTSRSEPTCEVSK